MKKGFALGQVLSNDTKTRVFGPRALAALRASGAQIVRLEFRTGPEPAWDQALIERYSGVVNDIEHAGVEILGLLSHQIVAGANQATWNANNAENGGNPHQDDPFRAHYLTAATQLVKAFPSVQLWEVWNEPNAWNRHPSPTVFAGATFIYPSTYAALIQAAVPAIKAAQPNARVLFGGLLSHNLGGNLTPDSSGATYLATVLQHLNGRSVPLDGIGIHPYLDNGARLDQHHLATAFGHVDSARAAVPSLQRLPFYVTEVGWQSPPLPPEQQAMNLQTLFEHCAQSGRVEAVCWFQIADNPAAHLSFGVCHADHTPKPAFEIFTHL